VFKGEFTRHILDRTRPRELHLIDVWWKLYGETYPDWGAYTDFGRLATREAFEMAQAAVRGHDRRRVAVFHVENDLECLSRFPNGHFDWVYLDSSHDYDQTLKELELLDRKLGPRGLIAGDDWREDPTHAHHGVCRAATEFCTRTSWRLVERDQFGQWCLSRRG
jgi:hypothetical protein